MKIYIIRCTYNISQNVIDCAFQRAADAKAYVKELNSDKAKAVARCRELIALRDGEAMVQFLDEEGGIEFEIMPTELK